MNSSKGPANWLEKAGPRKRLTINDIARLANVSKKTVSRVINNSASVRADTRVKIQSVIREQGYIPDPQARGLAFGRSSLIGFAWTEADTTQALDLQLGILDRLRETGFALVVMARAPGTPFADAIRLFVEARALHGVILAPNAAREVGVDEGQAGNGRLLLGVSEAAARVSAREAGWRAVDELLAKHA